MKKKRSIAYLPLWKRLGGTVSAAVLVVSMSPASQALAETASASGSAGATATSTQQSTEGAGQQNAPGAGQQGAAPQGGTPPAKPEGDTSGPQGAGGPGDANGQPPTPPDGQQGQPPSGAAPGGGGADTQSFDYTGGYTAAKTADGTEESSIAETIAASDKDQNAALAQNGGTLSITAGTLQKSGDDSGSADNTNFYGTNSGVLAVGEGSQVYISDSAVATSSAGSNGIFATDNATVYANNDNVSTTSSEGNARGLDATYGGTIVGNRLTVSTQGGHCAALATDRGGGEVSVANSELSTAGSGSPLIYSTGDIEVENVSGTATGSQIAGMEGHNSIYVSNSTLESTNDATSGSDPIKNGVIIYQSTSGDAETSTGQAARFEAVDSTLKSSITDGAMFYLTNTSAQVVLKNTKLDFDGSKVGLLAAQGNDSNNWGSAGSNGADVDFTLDGETASGDITADDISTARVWLLDGTSWTGAASVTENSAQDKTASASPLSINVDGDSTWTVTGDSTVTNLSVERGGRVVDASGKTATIKADGKTVVKGTGSVTVTVTGSYSTKVKTGSVNEVSGASIDRSGFDQSFATTTAFGKNKADADARGSSVATTTAPESADAAEGDDPLASLLQSILRLFGGN